MRAGEAADGRNNAELAHAIVLFGRALRRSEPDIWHPEEALALLDRGEAVFARLDRDRRQRSLTVRGMVLLRSGNAEGARSVLEEVFDATPQNDEVAPADAATHLAAACIATLSFDRAERPLRLAEAVDRRRDRSVGLLVTWFTAAAMNVHAAAMKRRCSGANGGAQVRKIGDGRRGCT